MPDTKAGREKQAREAEKRQREREIAAEVAAVTDSPDPEAEAARYLVVDGEEAADGEGTAESDEPGRST